MAILYVNQSATGSNNGNSWANAYTDLQTAIADASSGDEIWVAKGTYTPGTTREDSFTLKNRVEIYGGFAGTETSREQRDWENNETILSGEIGDTTDNSDNSYHVVLASSTTPNTVLDGFTITGGNANRSPNNNGGGILNTNGSPTFTNLLIKDNSASSRGGGIYNGNSIASFTNITFSNNSASQGGGIYNISSSSIFTDVNFSENSASSRGGGIYNEDSNPNLTNVDFKNNSASSQGGGIYNDDSSPSLTNVNFEDNTSENGGGIYNFRDSDPRITNTTFSFNLAGGGNGGAIYNNGSSRSSNNSNPVITNSLFQGNSSSFDGGAIYNDIYTDITINNSTFTKNNSVNGGAIFSVESTSDLARPSITINNSILWDNQANISDNEIGGTTAVVSHSIVEGGYPGTGNKQDDPLFVDPANGNFELQASSPGTDMGNNDLLPADVDDLDDDADTTEKIPFDLDGNPRIVNAIVDMGAYEAGQIVNPPPQPEISISDVSLLEGDSGSQNFGFTVSLSRSSSEIVTVDYTTADGANSAPDKSPATAPSDYTATSDNLTFNPGETSKTIDVPVIGDTIDESDETFFVNLSNATNATISDSQGTGTIIDDDGTPPILPLVTISDVSALEGNSGTTNFAFTVNLSTTSTETIALEFSTADGTNSATAGSDYTAISDTLTFNPGETSKTVNVSVIGDTTVESDETFLVNLSNATNAIISDPQGIGRILNDDSGTPVDVDTELSLLVDISGSVSSSEYNLQLEGYAETFENPDFYNNVISQGIEGQVAVNLIVWSSDNSQQESIGWTLIDSVQTSQDFARDIRETLLPASGGSRPFSGGTSPGAAINFAVPLFSSNPFEGRRWTIDVSGDGTGSSSASSSARDNALAAGVDVINGIVIGGSSSVLNFYRNNLIGGTNADGNPAFALESNGFNDFKAAVEQKLTIELNPPPQVSISDVSFLEGDSGTTDFVFDVNLSKANDETITIDYATADDTAVAGEDYAPTNGTLTFNAGETSKTVTVSVAGDNKVESDETFFVNLSNVTNADILDPEGIGTILNDDSENPNQEDVDTELSLLVDISESIDNEEYKTQIEGYIAAFNNEDLFNNVISEGLEGQVAVNLVVWAGEDQIQEVVDWTLIDSVETSKDFAIAIGNALLPESGGSRPFDGATAPGDAIYFAVPGFSSNVYDGRRWKIDLSTDGKWNDGINPATARDNALAAGVDVINAIVVSDDNTVVDFYEDNLIGGTGAFVSQTNDFTGFEQGIYDKLTTELTPLPLLSISDFSLEEGDSGTTDFVFNVTLSETSTEAIAVDFTTVDGSATAGKDYTATNGTLNFAAGETTKQVTVSVTGENRLEIDENFFVNLSNATNAEISDAQGIGTIRNDDEIQINPGNVDENSPEGTVVGLLSATDPEDTDDPFTFDLINDAGGRFKIVGNELQVANGDLLDFETNQIHTIEVQARDSQYNSGELESQEFTININDVNEGPSFGAVFTIEENSPEGTFVTQLSATDPENDTLTYAITSGNIDPDGDGTAAFAIDSATGRITVADSDDLDFETTPTFNLALTVTDENGLSDNARITINLADVDESESVSIDNATFSVAENSEEETVVGIIPAETNSNQAVLSVIENNSPIADDAIFELQENSNDETVIGIVTATDSETEALNFGITSGNLDPDKDNKQAFAIDPLTGAIIVNDSDDLDFETTPTFNLDVLATDADGLSDTADITINLIDVPPVEFAQDNSQNGFFALNEGESQNLKFTVDEVETDNINEVGLFIVDDENGNINGIAPDSPDYLQAALERSQVILSGISDIPSGFNQGDIERILEIDSNTSFGFYMISNASTDEVLSELESTGSTTVPVFFSNSSNMRVADLDTENFTLEWSEQAFNNDLTDIALNVELSPQAPALGTKLQRETQQELIDLSQVTDPVSVKVQVYREAAQDNLIGFYQITDINGGIDIDGDAVADINPGDTGYKQAALTNRITSLDLLQTENQQTTSFNGTFDGDRILAPFMIVDGTVDEALNDNAEVYFSFLGANSDGVDHIRLFGDNIFGFEDLAKGGDFDFNDVILEIDIQAI